MLGCYDTSRTRVVQTSQQNRQMVLVTAMATDTATDRTGAVEVVSFFTVSQVGDILAGQRKDAVLGRSVILDRDGHVIFGDMGDDAARDYFEDRLGRFTPAGRPWRRTAGSGITFSAPEPFRIPTGRLSPLWRRAAWASSFIRWAGYWPSLSSG